ncbi:MAG: outer membrane protein assembly factor BamD [Candidatus Eisenbacteria bacterium]
MIRRDAFTPPRGPRPIKPVRAVLALLTLAALSGCGAGVLPAVRTDAERLQVARRLAAEGERQAAIELLKGYVERNAGASDVDEALYLLGECYLGQKEWASAQFDFERLLRDYPESDSSGSAAFRLGEALFGQARGPDFDQEFTQKALTQWLEYRAGYPQHWRAPEGDARIREARDRLARKLLASGHLYLRLRMAVPARAYFERVAGEFGDLPLAGQAEIGLALCDRLEGKKAEAIARLQRIEAAHAGQPAATVARRERERTEKMKLRAPARPLPPAIPEIGS